MAVQLIQSSDTLSAGFRAKGNNNFNEIIQNSALLKDSNGAYTGVLRLVKNGGGFINVDLSGIYYTQAQIGQLISGVSGSPYSGEWSNATPYAALSVVDYEGQLWRSIIANNSDEPTTSGNWIPIINTEPATTVIIILKGAAVKRIIDWTSAFLGLDSIYGLTPKLQVHIQDEDPDNAGAICFRQATDLTPYEFRTGNVYNGIITEVHFYAHEDPDNAGKAAENTYLYISV